jgi:uncharacterized protein (TIGR02444 family)
MSDADHSKGEAMGASLWTFAVDLYGAPGVAKACLALQDRHRCDVNVLLFAAWMGAVRHRALTPVEMAEAAASVRDWHAEVVRPLRSLRRRLKSGPPPAPDETSEVLRDRIKCLELDAERIELTTLETLAAMGHTTESGDGGESLENLEVAIQHFRGGEPSAEALELVRVIAEGLRTRAVLAATQ